MLFGAVWQGGIDSWMQWWVCFNSIGAVAYWKPRVSVDTEPRDSAVGDLILISQPERKTMLLCSKACWGMKLFPRNTFLISWTLCQVLDICTNLIFFITIKYDKRLKISVLVVTLSSHYQTSVPICNEYLKNAFS